MNLTLNAEHLELITLNDAIASFSRLFANTVRYHHWHQCLEVLYVEDGFGVVTVDHKQYTMRPGRMFFFPPFTLHKIMVDEQAQDRYRRTIIHLDQHAVLKVLRDFPLSQQRLQKLSARGSEAWVIDAAEIHRHIDFLFSRYESLSTRKPLNAEHVACLLLNLLSMLPEDRHSMQEIDSGIASQVMFWLDENYTRKFRLDALAAEIGKSKSYVSRRFHYETGESILEYLNTLRLRKACEALLHSKASVREIAGQVGFSDVTYFISAFGKGIGETPLQYRKRHSA
ncbi:helix-turn-helix transcriptional regulator [Citrobacter rodentium]|uniref:Arabinose operon regulatory protein n=2 Tax=Citrobacter rodentium TaxID=67825 RepID=D2TRM6_CITRI|nr:AraC family transcriptional regulator [Citrobacter rodentium]KIQ49840.1 AraC family transcriptional regulator [Citrobacter rodentium]QBY29930.1 AraC family transcriptional regulator [Citrobacter rodentium]UHO32682.1 AraC family transcriptional regulator [Citrobacter rodentium NBRC 105723 = DSM 16636]CBG90286.1 putative AraC-family transcriptional regulator [Citrobacter rodentium ICC168]HAT8014274.1 AraC family transcriptional regulator [Citrobacter rodentium NBRC 105723 = DSM 16636]